MPDVVEHGPVEEDRGRLRPGAGRLAVVLALVVVVFLVSRSGLLSAGSPEPADPPPLGGTPSVPQVAESSRLIALVDDHLVRIGQDDWSEGARLPGPDPSSLVPVRAARGTGSVVGVDDGQLFRVVTSRSAQWSPIGRARVVLGAPATPDRAIVWRGQRVVEVDVGTGRVLEAAPFPGFDSSDGWSAEGLVAVLNTHALLMSRPRPGGTRQELALAWPAARVQTAFNPAVQSLGEFGPLLGIADDWVLTQEGTCPGEGCLVRVVTLTRDDVLVRDVVAPAGWSFVAGPTAGQAQEALVPVQLDDDAAVRALARLVPGGENALLVDGTEGVDLDAGFVDTADGAVYLMTRAGVTGPEQVQVWRPERAGRSEPVGPEGALPETARLVCVCG